MFQEKRCDRCGECLIRCPELQLPELEAKAEVEDPSVYEALFQKIERARFIREGVEP